MVKKMKIDKRGIRITRLAFLATSLWLTRKAVRAGRRTPVAWVARRMAPRLVRRAFTP